MRSWSALVVLLMVFSGCIASVPKDEALHDPASVGFSQEQWQGSIEELHDHANPLLHTNERGLVQLAWTDLAEGTWTNGVAAAGFLDVQTCGTLAVVASFAGNRGFTLVDLSTPSAPKVLSHYPTNSINWDVRFDETCSTVFVGMELGTVGAFGSIQALGLQDTGRGGILVVDITDPSQPKLESWNSVGSVHNLYSADIAGETWVFDEDVRIWRVDGERGSRTLTHVASVPGRHDVAVERHPTSGVPYLFTGYRHFTFYDISDPTDPGPQLGTTLPPGESLWHEQTPAPMLIDGRWIVVGGSEDDLGQAEPFVFLDVTDPDNALYMGSWLIPDAPFSMPGDYIFSAHNVAVRGDGMVAMAHYHAGVWVVDASTQVNQQAPVTVGYAQPHEVSPLVVREHAYSPYVWGVDFLDSGELVVADLNSGLYVYQVPEPIGVA